MLLHRAIEIIMATEYSRCTAPFKAMPPKNRRTSTKAKKQKFKTNVSALVHTSAEETIHEGEGETPVSSARTETASPLGSPASKRSASPDRREHVSVNGEYNLYYHCFNYQ